MVDIYGEGAWELKHPPFHMLNFFIINYLDIRYHVELNVLIVKYYQKISYNCFYHKAVQDKYLRSSIINIAPTKILNPPLYVCTILYNILISSMYS